MSGSSEEFAVMTVLGETEALHLIDALELGADALKGTVHGAVLAQLGADLSAATGLVQVAPGHRSGRPVYAMRRAVSS